MNQYKYNHSFSSYNNLFKYFKKDAQIFKQHFNCFSLFENRIVQGICFEFGNVIFVDVGFKYIIKLDKQFSGKYYTLLKFVKLETLFNDPLIDFLSIRNNIFRKLNWSAIKRAFNLNSILPGKVLNPVKNGFSVGIHGFVGFMPKKHSVITNCSLRSVFIISNIDMLKKTFILSQKQIDKTIFRVLFKLSSQISYISKN
uniref:Ribosomal protein S1 n=1 Tax=Cryptomonas curvata TaxID=233186 RepID=A0A2P1G8F9_9CRYP|nr:ribosomal protein S1 [Cryptomonas curvata]AVM81248.1 ribosomal protein S1 [Cryptomonas curvata]